MIEWLLLVVLFFILVRLISFLTVTQEANFFDDDWLYERFITLDVELVNYE